MENRAIDHGKLDKEESRNQRLRQNASGKSGYRGAVISLRG
jgi:hypothetical protein